MGETSLKGKKVIVMSPSGLMNHKQVTFTDKNIEVRLPFRDDGINKKQVLEILERSTLGLPAYYKWRSRSGCTFCFFQQKMEWVNLKKFHPQAFEAAKTYEKLAIEHDSPFTWTKGESLVELERPERIKY